VKYGHWFGHWLLMVFALLCKHKRTQRKIQTMFQHSLQHFLSFFKSDGKCKSKRYFFYVCMCVCMCQSWCGSILPHRPTKIKLAAGSAMTQPIKRSHRRMGAIRWLGIYIFDRQHWSRVFVIIPRFAPHPIFELHIKMNLNVPESDSEDELPSLWEERATNDGYVYYVK
jgi:hypothetical protein